MCRKEIVQISVCVTEQIDATCWLTHQYPLWPSLTLIYYQVIHGTDFASVYFKQNLNHVSIFRLQIMVWIDCYLFFSIITFCPSILIHYECNKFNMINTELTLVRDDWLTLTGDWSPNTCTQSLKNEINQRERNLFS